ncbi:MAG: hypothetical protein WB781_18300 [Candidatus Sulfotelmatobacter sp.]
MRSADADCNYLKPLSFDRSEAKWRNLLFADTAQLVQLIPTAKS